MDIELSTREVESPIEQGVTALSWTQDARVPLLETLESDANIVVVTVSDSVESDPDELLHKLEGALSFAEAEVTRRLESCVPKVSFAPDEAPLAEIYQLWTEVGTGHHVLIASFVISLGLLSIGWNWHIEVLASPYLVVALNFPAFAEDYWRLAHVHRARQLGFLEGLKERASAACRAVPAGLEERLDEFCSAIQDAVGGQAPLLSQLHEVARWLTSEIPDPASLLSPVRIVVEKVASNAEAAAGRTFERFADCVPKALRVREMFSVIFVVIPLVVQGSVNVVFLLCFGSSSVQLFISTCQVTFCIMVTLARTLRRLLQLIEELVQRKMTFWLQEEMGELMVAIDHGLRTSLELFWPVLRCLLLLLKRVMALRAALLRIKGLLKTLPGEVRDLLHMAREDVGAAASEALKSCDHLTRRLRSTVSASAGHLLEVGKDSLAEAERHEKALSVATSQTAESLRDIANKAEEMAGVVPQMLERVIQEAREELAKVVSTARAIVPDLGEVVRQAVATAGVALEGLAEEALAIASQFTHDLKEDGGVALADAAAKRAAELELAVAAAEASVVDSLSSLASRTRQQLEGLRGALEVVSARVFRDAEAARDQLVAAGVAASSEAALALKGVLDIVEAALAAAAEAALTETRAVIEELWNVAAADLESLASEASEAAGMARRGVQTALEKARAPLTELASKLRAEIESAVMLLAGPLEGINVAPLGKTVDEAKAIEAGTFQASEIALFGLAGELGGKIEAELVEVTDGARVAASNLRDAFAAALTGLKALDRVNDIAQRAKCEVIGWHESTKAPIDNLVAATLVVTEKLGTNEALSEHSDDVRQCSVLLEQVLSSVEDAQAAIFNKLATTRSGIHAAAACAARLLGIVRVVEAIKATILQLGGEVASVSQAALMQLEAQMLAIVSKRDGFWATSEEAVSYAEAGLAAIADRCIAIAEDQAAILGRVVSEAQHTLETHLASTIAAKVAEVPDRTAALFAEGEGKVKCVRLAAEDALSLLAAELHSIAGRGSSLLKPLLEEARHAAESLWAQAKKPHGVDSRSALLQLVQAARARAGELEHTAELIVGDMESTLEEFSHKVRQETEDVRAALVAAVGFVNEKLADLRAEVRDSSAAALAEARSALGAVEAVSEAAASAIGPSAIAAIRDEAVAAVRYVDETLDVAGAEVAAFAESARGAVRELVDRTQTSLACLSNRASAKVAEAKQLVGEAGMEDVDGEASQAILELETVIVTAATLSDELAGKAALADASFAAAKEFAGTLESLRMRVRTPSAKTWEETDRLAGIATQVSSAKQAVGESFATASRHIDALASAANHIPTDAGIELRATISRVTLRLDELVGLKTRMEEVSAPVREARRQLKGLTKELHDAANGVEAAMKALMSAEQLGSSILRKITGNLGWV